MSFFSWCQIVRFIMLVPNCPGAKLSGAKLSVFIMLVPNCPGAKLSGAKLSWCQIVLVPNCPVPNCPVPNCPTTHCTRQKSLLGRHRPSKWLQMAKNAILWPWAGLVDPNWWNKVGTSQSTPRQCHGTISLVKNAHWGAQLPQKCPKKSSKGP